MHEDIYVHLCELPGRITEAVTVCDGGYNITIDPRQSYEGMIRSYLHAIRHIDNHDFDKPDVQSIEADAHDHASKRKELN